MKFRIKVTDVDIAMLERNKNKIIMDTRRRILVVTDFTVEVLNEPKRILGFKTNEIVERKYLTKITILGYNLKGKFLASFEDGGYAFLMLNDNFDKLRQNWLDFKEELKAFKLEVQDIPKPVKVEPEEDLTDTMVRLAAQVFNEIK